MTELNIAANGIPAGTIGSFKKAVVHNIILHMPTDAVVLLHEAYSRMGWERSYMNEDLLRNTYWRPNKALKAAPEWKTVYTTTKETVTLFADLLDKHWISLWENDAAILQASQTEVDRRKPSKTFDIDIPEMTTSTMLLFMVQFYLLWLLPQVTNVYGEAGKLQLEEMWKEFSPQFQNNLKFAIKLKDRGATRDELTLKQLSWIYPKLAGQTEEQTLQEQVQDTRTSTLNAWEVWQTKWDDVIETFLKVVANRDSDAQKRLAHDLTQATNEDVEAARFSEEFMKGNFAFAPIDKLHAMSRNLRVQHELAIEGAGSLIAASCGGPSTMPTLVVWDLNAVLEPEPTSELNAFKEILNARPCYTAGLVITRQRPLGEEGKRNFNQKMSKALGALGLNVDNDFVFTTKDTATSGGPHTIRQSIITAWLAFPLHDVGTSIWDWSSIVRGLIQDIPLPQSKDARQPVCNQAGERHMKAGGFVHTAALSMLLETVYGKSADWLTQTGMPTPRLENNQPMVAVIGLNSWGFNLGDAILAFQTKFRGAAAGAHLVATIATRDPDDEVKGDIMRQLCEAWRTGKLTLQGFPKPVRSNYLPDNEASLVMDHDISLVDTLGTLKPKMPTLERFQAHPATAQKVVAFLAQEEQEQETRPKWPSSASALAHGSASVPEVPAALQGAPTLVASFSTLEELQAAPQKLQSRVADGSLIFYVMGNGQGWAHALKEVTVTAGVKILGWGTGKNMDDLQATAKQGHSKVKMAITNDKAIVFYKHEGGSETRYTLHGLLSQLALDGKGSCKVKGHTLTDATPSTSAPTRFSVVPASPKHHVSSKPMVADEGETTSVPPLSVMRFLQGDTVSSQYFSQAFEVKVESVGVQYWVVLERPMLVWTQTKIFKKDFIFRWA